MTDTRVFNVLFLCTGNSARSIMAEALLNRIGRGRFKAFSAGSMPAGKLNPHTIEVLNRMGFPPDQFRSKSWEEFTGTDAPQLDFVFTVCDKAAEEVCPIWPGQPMTAHWGLPDPVAVKGSPGEIAVAFGDTFRLIANRLNLLINLPIESLDKLSLQRRLDSIGKETKAPDGA